MNVSSSLRFICILAAAVVASACGWSKIAIAQNAAGTPPASGTTPATSGITPATSGTTAPRPTGQRETIEPYTGPPIYLEQEKQVAPPTLVNRQTIKDEYEDGKLRSERQVARFSDNHFEADGMYREFYPDGKPFVEGTFVRGRQHGEWTYYYDNGQVNRKATYKNGQPDGAWEVFRADGTLAAKRGFSDGLRHGQWVLYDATGKKPLREETYDRGKLNGQFKLWFPSGQLRQQVGFKLGERDGMTVEWTEKGDKRAEIPYVAGKPHGTATLWLPDGRKIVQRYQEGRLVAESKE
jgi:antitoxin component YwqK of YwqJK toxin-antitoxin module